MGNKPIRVHNNSVPQKNVRIMSENRTEILTGLTDFLLKVLKVLKVHLAGNNTGSKVTSSSGSGGGVAGEIGRAHV